MPKKKVVFDIEDIKRKLPHRYPFLMIDRIIETDTDHCIGTKNVTANEPYFQGHFPAESIMPGVLIAEAMVQTAAFIGGTDRVNSSNNKMHKAFLTNINMRIHKPVVPGDQLVINMSLVKTMGKLSKCQGKVTVDGEVIAVGEFNIAEV